MGGDYDISSRSDFGGKMISRRGSRFHWLPRNSPIMIHLCSVPHLEDPRTADSRPQSTLRVYQVCTVQEPPFIIALSRKGNGSLQ